MSVLFAYTTNREKKSKITIPAIAREESIEVVIEESYNYTNQVSNVAIEEGSDITDHIHTSPLVYSLTALYSNAPLTEIEIGTGDLPEAPKRGLISSLPILKAFTPLLPKVDTDAYTKELTETLSEKTSEFIDYIPSIEAFYEELIREKHIVSIETKNKLLEDMVCIDFSYTRNKSSGSGLLLTAKFQQIKIVSTDTIEIQARDSKIESSKTSSGVTAETKETGKKKTQTEAPGSQGSLLHRLILG